MVVVAFFPLVGIIAALFANIIPARNRVISHGGSTNGRRERVLQGNVTSSYVASWHMARVGTCVDATRPSIILKCNGGDGIAIESQSSNVTCESSDGSGLTVQCIADEMNATSSHNVDFICTGSSLDETTAEATIPEQVTDCIVEDELAEWGHGLVLALVCDGKRVQNGTCTPLNTTFPDTTCSAGWFCPDDCQSVNYTIETLSSTISDNDCSNFASPAVTVVPSQSPTRAAVDTVPATPPSPLVLEESVASFYTVVWNVTREGSCADTPAPTVLLSCTGGDGITIESQSLGVICASVDEYSLTVECTTQTGGSSQSLVDFNCMGLSYDDTSASATIQEVVDSCVGGGVAELGHGVQLKLVCDANRMSYGTCSPLNTTKPDSSCSNGWSCPLGDCPAQNYTVVEMTSTINANGDCSDNVPPPQTAAPSASPIRAPTPQPSIATPEEPQTAAPSASPIRAPTPQPSIATPEEPAPTIDTIPTKQPISPPTFTLEISPAPTSVLTSRSCSESKVTVLATTFVVTVVSFV